MRPLPPTLRENRRYILIKVEAGEITQKDIYRAAADSVRDLFGDVGASRIHPAVIWSEGEYAIVRCSRGCKGPPFLHLKGMVHRLSEWPKNCARASSRAKWAERGRKGA